jgi:hypothetical protein
MPESLAISPFGVRISFGFRISAFRPWLRRAKIAAKTAQANGLPWGLDILHANGVRAYQPRMFMLFFRDA